MKLTLIVLSLILCFGLQVGIQAQEITSTTLTFTKTNLVSGDTTTATIESKNIQTLSAPFVLTATATWTDTSDVTHTTSANSLPIQVIRPVTINIITIPLPSNLAYVDTSASSNGTSIPATVANGVLSLTINKLIKEQESVMATLQLKAK